MRKVRAYAIGLAAGVLLMLGGQAAAQQVQIKHFGCYGAGPQSWRAFYYLADPAAPCPPGWTKIDWLDD